MHNRDAHLFYPDMPRIARVALAGVPHHVTQRGNRRQDVFFSDGDRAAYLGWLAYYCRRFHLEVLAYCLQCRKRAAVRQRGLRERAGAQDRSSAKAKAARTTGEERSSTAKRCASPLIPLIRSAMRSAGAWTTCRCRRRRCCGRSRRTQGKHQAFGIARR